MRWETPATDLGNVIVDNNGNFITTFIVPSTAETGQHNVFFNDIEGRTFNVTIFTVTQEGQPPVAPSNVKAEAITYEGQPGTKVSWIDNADNELGFRIVDQNRPQEYDVGPVTGVGSTGSLIVPYYSCFRVAAYSAYDRSRPSDAACTGLTINITSPANIVFCVNDYTDMVHQ